MRNWILVAVILLVIGLIGIGGTFGGDGMFNLGGVAVNQHQEVDASGVNNIGIDTGSMDLTVVKGGTNAIKADLTGKASKKYIDKIILKLEKNGDTIKVTVDDKVGFNFGISILNLNLRLELPEAQYDSIMLNAGSGNSSFSGIAADTVELECGSGDIRLDGLKAAKRLSVTVGSGNMHAEDVIAGAAEFKAASGDVTLEKLQAEELEIQAHSGNTRLTDVAAPVKATAGSGDIRAELDSIDYPMTLKTGSGNVSVHTADRPESLHVQFEAGSGSMHDGWHADDNFTRDGTRNLVFGDGAKELAVTTGSGDLSIGRR